MASPSPRSKAGQKQAQPTMALDYSRCILPLLADLKKMRHGGYTGMTHPIRILTAKTKMTSVGATLMPLFALGFLYFFRLTLISLSI
jgi:hypothetical protein